MSASESYELVGWLIDAVPANWPDGTIPDKLSFVDRDNSETYDGVKTLRSRKGELTKANYLSFSKASTTPTAQGPGYDLDREDVVSCRLEGLHTDQYGHVDNAAAFQQLWRNIRDAIYADRRRPVGDYHTLFIENIRDASGDYRDYFRVDFEVRFWGCEELP
jgi:hypothetical protein